MPGPRTPVRPKSGQKMKKTSKTTRKTHDRAVHLRKLWWRSSRLGLTWGNVVRVAGCPQVKRAVATLSGGRCSVSGLPGWRLHGWLAVPAGVVLGDGEAEFLEFGEELAEAAVVVEPGAVVGELVVGEDAGGGLAVFLAGPLVVGAVRLWRGRVGGGGWPGAAGGPGRGGGGAGEEPRGRARPPGAGQGVRG